MQNYNGSIWNKWDLHVHTPYSLVHNYKTSQREDIWEKYISDLENLPKDFKVIGINDYNFLDGYNKVKKYKINGRLNNIELILPVLEFRIKKFSGTKTLKRINFHVIFSNEVDSIIESQFLNALKPKYKLSPGLKKEYWNALITLESLKELGKKIKASVPQNELKNFESDLMEGFNNLNLEENEIFEALENNYFNNKFLTCIGKTEWDAFNWNESSIAEKKDIINKVDFVFTASENIENYKKGKNKLKEQKVNHLLLDCSDAHNFSESTNKDKIGNCNTWIKGDITFETLKQVKFESDSRLIISENRPLEPLTKIDKVTFDFPSGTKINNQKFCLTGKNEINFSPYFTCLIGGRGSGKSLILNLLEEKINPGKNKFVKEYNIDIPDNKKLIDCIHLDDFEQYTTVEFLSQNEIAMFVNDQDQLTKMIYERIKKRDDNSELHEMEIYLQTEIKDEIGEQIYLIKEFHDKRKELNELKVINDKNKKLIKSFTNSEYVTISNAIEKLSLKIFNLNVSNENYEYLISKIKEIVEQFKIIEPATTEYDSAANNILKEMNEIYIKYGTVDNIKFIETIKSIQQDLNRKKLELSELLKKNGFVEDDMKDLSNAITETNNIERDMLILKREITDIKQEIDLFNISELKKLNSQYQQKLETLIKPLNEELHDLNKYVKPISINVIFDKPKALSQLFIEFRKTFANYFDQKYIKEETIREYLFCVEPKDIIDQHDFISKITHDNHLSKLNQSEQILYNIFSEEKNFKIYLLLINEVFLNYSEYKKILITYDGKPIEHTSFGQRCTATLVLLILLGNNPIIIDEPEAHLDSLLIANYLVDLIKLKKKHRQIIYATHNANFVINGDAELIHILSIDSNTNYTKVNSTSIENIEHRNSLLELEGGIEAFEKREMKYKSV